MLDPSNWLPAAVDPAEPPRLLVFVDTEEEFDWSKPVDRSSTGVSSMATQGRAQRIFADYGIVPTYLVDYPVVAQEAGAAPLAEFLADGACHIGAHLHPWVTPPHDETVSQEYSYPGNLPKDLERKKLKTLTDAIAERFGAPPTVYRAGRYGVGPNTADILEDLGYMIDTSVVPRSDFGAEHGPDFSYCPIAPYWFGKSRKLLELPLTVEYVGALQRWAPPVYRWASSKLGSSLRLNGVTSRLGLLDRLRLSPEGISSADHRRLTKALLQRGCRIFSFTYHSPSLMPGGTPYVTTERELERFLDRFRQYFDYFFGELDGTPSTPHAVYKLLES
ncbi:MAG: polysaccharide deacetylase family protein [Sphingomonadales bacterium]|nr:polysaccharide deacetylase family protein [Sphingomonadales bacterium]